MEGLISARGPWNYVSSALFCFPRPVLSANTWCSHGISGGPLTDNLYIEDFEQKALSTFAHPPDWWKRYVDDMHTKFKKIHAQAFTDDLKTIDEDIQ